MLTSVQFIVLIILVMILLWKLFDLIDSVMHHEHRDKIKVWGSGKITPDMYERHDKYEI